MFGSIISDSNPLKVKPGLGFGRAIVNFIGCTHVGERTCLRLVGCIHVDE